MEHRGATDSQLLPVRNNTSYLGLFLGDIANKRDCQPSGLAFLVGARDIEISGNVKHLTIRVGRILVMTVTLLLRSLANL
jgi:hypothetical protein